MFLILIIILLVIAVFFIIISRFGGTNLDNIGNEDISTVNYVPKQFLSNNEYNFLTKFIDL